MVQYPEFKVNGEYLGHVRACTAIAINASELLIATGGNDAITTLWDVNSMGGVKTYIGSDAPITNLSFSFDSRYLAFNNTSIDGKSSVDVAALDGKNPVHRYDFYLSLPSFVHSVWPWH